MPTLIDAPQVLPVAGTFSPSGWSEPGQQPDFEEIAVCTPAFSLETVHRDPA